MNIPCVQGIYRDILREASGRTRDFGWRSNLIVLTCRELLAAFMQGGQANPQGIRLLQVGRGSDAWDETPPPPADESRTSLEDARPFAIPIEPAQVVFLDPDGKPRAAPSNRLQLAVTLAPGAPPVPAGQEYVPLREFGLFGAISDRMYMINYVRHPVIFKKADDTLERIIRLVF